jgi:two-component system, OmpR family, phosphate regulon sensor histidine kinase PhoR
MVEADINEVVSGVFETYKFHLQNNGFTFRYVPCESLPVIRIDQEAVSEALINLVDNAIKYSEDRKDVGIYTGKENNFVLLKCRIKVSGYQKKTRRKF